MKNGFSAADAVRQRRSVRTYSKKPVPQELRQKLLEYAAGLVSPWGHGISVRFIEKTPDERGDKLGTYGVIKGAETYLAVVTQRGEHAAEAIGYGFEQLVLYAQSLGLGTCWLGGTFRRSAFAAQLELKENEIFPILSPVGYAAEKCGAFERAFRASLRADSRLPWEKIFFKNGFAAPLTEADAGQFRIPFEMTRLAPSAVNRQPWRVTAEDGAFHFYKKSFSGAPAGETDMQRIDVGIALCHFDMAARELDLAGKVERLVSGVPAADGLTYIASWVKG